MRVVAGAIIGGKYLLERTLATGGHGEIWRARHMQLGSVVALKLMSASMVASPTARARFEREATAVSKIRHPNIIHVQDCGVEGELPYLVMELLQGENLSERIRSEKRLSLDSSARILNQVFKGLRHLHENGYVHRDLKPGNIFLAKNEDGEEIVKILDFGITITPAEYIEAFAAPRPMGSPFYMSPEQFQRAAGIDARSDLWSLAVVLFRMVTGQLPFQGEAESTVVWRVLAGPIPAPSSILPELPPALDDFFQRALARSRDQRFQTVTEMAEAFGQIAGIRAPMPSTTYAEEVHGWNPQSAEALPKDPKTADELLRILSRTAREELLNDPRWDAFAAGALPEHEVEALRSLAERSEVAREVFELVRPPTADDLAALTERVRRQRVAQRSSGAA